MKEKFKITLLVYLAMVGAVASYAVLIFVLKDNPQFQMAPLPVEQVTILRYVFYFLSLIQFFAIGFLRKMMLLRTVITYQAQTAGKSGETSESVSEKPIPDFFPIEVMTFALCETVAIYGLLLFFLGKRSEDFYPFMAISLGYLAVYFPKYSQWEEWESRLTQKSR